LSKPLRLSLTKASAAPRRFAGDTAICPTDQLGYLGQFVGVSLPPDVDDATARSLITGEAGTHRGTPSAIEMAAKRYLSGTQSVINVERTRPDGSRSGYWFVLIVKPEEVIDAVALTAAVNAVKPGGVLWALVESDGAPWVSDSGTWASDSSSWSS
jgi:hypothetical protein